MYDPVTYWKSAGRTYEPRWRRTAAFDAQEMALTALLERLDFSTVLDVGCGFGRIGEIVVATHPEASYTGLDLSPDQIAAARRRLPDGEFIESAFEDFKPDGRTWDLVIASEVLMHQLPEKVEMFTTALRLLARQHLVTLDWDDATGMPARAAHNFCHDYRSLYGPAAERIVVGRQGIWHLDLG